MAVLRCAKKAGTWSGSATSETNGLLYEVVRRRYSATFLVYVDDPGDGPQVVFSSILVPQVGDSYALFNDADTLATCIDVGNFRYTDNPYIREVDAEFDTNRVVAAITDHPLNQPALIRWRMEPVERPLFYSADGVGIVTSSGEMYDPVLTYTDRNLVCTITRNEAAYNPADAYAYIDTLNLVTFAGAAPTFARLNVFDGDPQFANGLFYYKVTYEIELDRYSHVALILDAGYRNKDKQLFRDPVNFEPLSNATFLNGRGYERTRGTTTLSGGISDSATSLTVAAYADFPPGCEPDDGVYGYIPSGDGFFNIRIDDEVIKVTTRKPISSGTWTVERGMGGTVAAAHSGGATVTLEPYFRRFLRAGLKDWTPLSLPAV